MAKYNVPKRKYCEGPKKMISIRVHEKLLAKVEGLAQQKGWTVTDVVSTVLDQYVQFEEKKSKER